MGYPKAEMLLRGRPVLDLLIERLAWPGPRLLVTAPGREHPAGWERFTREVADPAAGQGPLRGLLTALENAPTPRVVVTAVDMPFVRQEHLHWLADALRGRRGTSGLMPRRPRTGQVESFPCAFAVTAIPILRVALQSERRSVHGLLDDPGMVAVDAPASWGSEVWTNLNTPDDLASLKE